MSKKNNPIVRACKRCGKLEKPTEVTENWKVYSHNEQCECGGTFGFMLEEKRLLLERTNK